VRVELDIEILHGRHPTFGTVTGSTLASSDLPCARVASTETDDGHDSVSGVFVSAEGHRNLAVIDPTGIRRVLFLVLCRVVSRGVG
jgi:hypothetical protein